MSPRILWG